ncbi:alpha/beta hydrolase [Pseudomonas aegrilactucae]|uniref:Alpha/beta hydrolase n=1 Tax=Pseudomonas aegrilactucae TaxID=2854028 RepID=A0A9Q2XN97_9PSED|nr:alpha/beta hydrolase [Pseudomonas aegrilactucae]MBV6290191.1 alpha/beta hydrolase [Pseudomonas aegrilactucae]
MPLDPDLEGFLELAQMGRLSGKSRALHELDVALARTQFDATSLVLDPCPPAAITVSELSIPTRDGQRIAARLYRAHASDTALLPTLLYFHGGGYVVGSLDSHDSICRRLAASGRHAVLAPAYRLAPEYPFPTAVQDALDAANWLAEQATSLHLDNQRVTLAGDSAGATLATVLAITAVKQPQALQLRPKAQLLFYPVTDTSRQRESHRRYAEDYLLETATLEWFYHHYSADPAQHLDWRVSPLLASDLDGLAPAYVSLAEYDPLFDEGLEYANRLQASGASVTLKVQQGLTHDFLRMGGIVGDVDGIYAAVDHWLSEQ